MKRSLIAALLALILCACSSESSSSAADPAVQPAVPVTSAAALTAVPPAGDQGYDEDRLKAEAERLLSEFFAAASDEGSYAGYSVYIADLRSEYDIRDGDYKQGSDEYRKMHDYYCNTVIKELEAARQLFGGGSTDVTVGSIDAKPNRRKGIGMYNITFSADGAGITGTANICALGDRFFCATVTAEKHSG